MMKFDNQLSDHEESVLEHVQEQQDQKGKIAFISLEIDPFGGVLLTRTFWPLQIQHLVVEVSLSSTVLMMSKPSKIHWTGQDCQTMLPMLTN